VTQPIILDGYKLAEQHRKQLEQKTLLLRAQGLPPVVAAVLFVEDAGSTLYTELKRQMAESLGVGYQVYSFSIKDPIELAIKKIHELNQDNQVSGIIVQKPWRQTWLTAKQLKPDEGNLLFRQWWWQLVTAINLRKDVDGLHPKTLDSIQHGTWQKEGKVLPATCKAVVELLKAAFNTTKLFEHLRQKHFKTVILGKSDLLGQPLFALLQSEECSAEMIGSQELNERIAQKKFLKDADIIVSATGRAGLITGEMVKEGVVAIDVGEPKGDLDFASVATKAAVITPVPGGVGPMTVVSLMENAVELISR
jgi:methylenetetrahydrofolate dehydrogenase (NADP+)/methenyltetrahydrofolate cyclohydrolase